MATRSSSSPLYHRHTTNHQHRMLARPTLSRAIRNWSIRARPNHYGVSHSETISIEVFSGLLCAFGWRFSV